MIKMLKEKLQLNALIKIINYYQLCYPYKERMESKAYNKVVERADKLAKKIVKHDNPDAPLDKYTE